MGHVRQWRLVRGDRRWQTHLRHRPNSYDRNADRSGVCEVGRKGRRLARCRAYAGQTSSMAGGQVYRALQSGSGVLRGLAPTFGQTFRRRLISCPLWVESGPPATGGKRALAERQNGLLCIQRVHQKRAGDKHNDRGCHRSQTETYPLQSLWVVSIPRRADRKEATSMDDVALRTQQYPDKEKWK